MQRHKSKVMRRSRRKGRMGTRKQAGGFFSWLLGKKENPPGSTDAPAPAATPGAAPATPGAAPAAPAAPAKTGFLGLWGGGGTKKSRKSRKTSHHHRRRRHHRK